MGKINVDYDVLNQKGSPAWYSDLFANIPTPGYTGRMFISTDTFAFYRDNGTGWDLTGGPGIGTITGSGVSGQVSFFSGTQVLGGSTNLIWDNTNNRLGIGVASPTVTLDISGSVKATALVKSGGTSAEILLADGTTTPTSTFQAAITLTTTGTTGASTLVGATLNVPTYTFVSSVSALTLGTSGTDLTSSVANSTTTPTITLNVPTASATNRGALSSADFTTFNNKQATITLTTTGTSGAATLVGATLNVPNYTNVGTVTSVAALTLGTSGTDLSSSVANSTSTPVITLNVPTASATNRGALSSADFTTFNNKQATISVTAPVVLTGATISMPAATTSVNGYLTSTDWNTFNNKSNTNGTVTSVVALTIGTSGIDITSTAVTTTTTPVITLNVPTASASNRGALSSTDWTIFNNKQATLSLTTTGTSGAATLVANTLNIPNYGSALSGYVPYTGATTNLNLGSFNVTADFVVVGTTAASSGGIRLGTQVAIRARNVGNTANIPLIESTSTDGVSVSNGTLILESTGLSQFNNNLTIIGSSSSSTIGTTGQLQISSSTGVTSPASDIYLQAVIDSSTPGDRGTAFVVQTGRTSGIAERLRIASTGAATFSSTGLFGGELSVGGTLSADRMFQVSGTAFTSGATQFGIVNNPTMTTPTTIYGYYGGVTVTSATTAYGMYIVSNGGTITNKFGLYQEGTNDKNYFGGYTGIGTTTPSGIFHAQATNSGIYFDLTTAYTPKIKAAGTISDLQIESVGSGGNMILGAPGATSIMQFYVNGTLGTGERMRINQAGESIFGYDNAASNKYLVITPIYSSAATPVNIQGVNAGVGAYNISLNASGGKVLIGTSTASTAISLNDILTIGASTASNAVKFTNGGSTNWGYIVTEATKIVVGSDNNVDFEAGATLRYRITSAGINNYTSRGNYLGATDNALFSLNSGGTLYTVGFSPTATASSTNTFTLTTGTTTWIYTGTGTATWTLPNPSGNNQIYWIKNAGTGIITLNAFSGTNIINNAAASVSSITIAVGATAVIAQDGNVKSYQLQ